MGPTTHAVAAGPTAHAAGATAFQRFPTAHAVCAAAFRQVSTAHVAGVLGELGVSLLMLNWYLYISRPKEKRGEPRATVPLISSNYSEGPVSTQVLLRDGPLNQVPILQA